MLQIIGQRLSRGFIRTHRIGMWHLEDFELSALTLFLILSALSPQAFPLRCYHRREEVVLGAAVEVLEVAAPLEGVSEVAAEEVGNLMRFELWWLTNLWRSSN
jgi:hypothetical protein